MGNLVVSKSLKSTHNRSKFGPSPLAKLLISGFALFGGCSPKIDPIGKLHNQMPDFFLGNGSRKDSKEQNPTQQFGNILEYLSVNKKSNFDLLTFQKLEEDLSNRLNALPKAQASKEFGEMFKQIFFYESARGMAIPNGLLYLYNSENSVVTGIKQKALEAWGLLEENGSPLGVKFVSEGPGQFASIGCSVCHVGKAYGELIPGLGNKLVDIAQFGRDGQSLSYTILSSAAYALNSRDFSSQRRAVEATHDGWAYQFLDRLADDRVTNLTAGLVSVGIVRAAFYEDGPPEGMHRSQVKIPQLWGFAEKRVAGAFNDGSGDAVTGGWGLGVEIVGGVRPETVHETRFQEKANFTERMFQYFQPPAYPEKIDQEKATRGLHLYETYCTSCHGQHERAMDGSPIFKTPKIISWDELQTDRDKLDGDTEDFVQKVASAGYSPFVRINPNFNQDEPGYFAPTLWGIWARFPYLHNGSVPTIRDLLHNPALRPRRFYLKDAGEVYRYDVQNMGLTSETIPSMPSENRLVYDVTRVGHSNQGHFFWGTGDNSGLSQLSTADEDALIEYLKTL